MSSPTGPEIMAQFLPQSPFVTKLGILPEVLDGDEVRVRLPWDPTNVTLGDMVHGGAIAALADITVMTAAWAGVLAAESLRGVTTSRAGQSHRPDRRRAGAAARQDVGQLRRGRHHAGRRTGRQGDRDLQSGVISS